MNKAKPPGMRFEVCRNCRFWDGATTNAISALCCRMPPVPMLGVFPARSARDVGSPDWNGELIGRAFPRTCENDWCGEFEKDPGT